MKEQKAKTNKFWVRMMAWILCILMVVSLAYLTIVLIVDHVRTEREAANKEAQENTETNDSSSDENDDHDHDGDGIADH